MTSPPTYNEHAVRAEILRGLDLSAYAAEGHAAYQDAHGGVGKAARAAHHTQVGKVLRRLHTISAGGLLDHLGRVADDDDDSYQTQYESRYAWHTIRLYRALSLLDAGESNFFESYHPAQCSTLPPGACCWFTDDRRGDWWPTPDQHGIYRIRPGHQLTGGGPDGDDPDVTEYFDIQVLDESTGAWSDWHGRTVGQAELEAANSAPAVAAAPAVDDPDTARLKQARLAPLTENVWTEIRAFAWSPAFEAPAGTPARYGLELLRTALAEAERLAGRAHTNRADARALAGILANHRVMALVDGISRTPQLYTDLMEWLAVAVERETYRLREQDINLIPDKIPARVKADTASEPSDGRIQIRRRTLPERLDYWATLLAGLDPAHIPSNADTIISAAFMELGSIAAELRAKDAGREQLQRDHAEAVKVLGRLVDHEDTPCRSDSYGYCTEHHSSQPCDVPEARALLARIRSEQTDTGQ